MGTRHSTPPRPATASCRDCEWRYDPVLPRTSRVDLRDAATEAHVEATGHQVTVSMPGFPGYQILGSTDPTDG
jgi:hypothetical protein